MNLPRRLLGLLPLLAIIGIGSLWLLANASSREREQAEASIRLRWESPSEVPAVSKDVAAYLARYGGDRDAVWFAVEALGHLRDPAGALAALTSHAGVRDEKGAAPRLARLLIEPLRSLRGRSNVPSPLASSWLYVLMEAGDPDALRQWSALAAHAPPLQTDSFFVAARTPSPAATAVGTALAARTDDPIQRTTGAILLSGPKRKDDIPLLLETFRAPWREEDRIKWELVVRALGTTGDPRAVEALKAYVEKGTGDLARLNRATVDMGLALTGDADARARLFATAAELPLPRTLIFYGVGLSIRLAQGDESAVPRLVEPWDGSTDPLVRHQVAQAVLVAEPPPPASFPSARWADDLIAGDPVSRALGHAARFRLGLDPVFGPLGADLVEAARMINFDDTRTYTDAGPFLIEVLRAWIRFGR